MKESTIHITNPHPPNPLISSNSLQIYTSEAFLKKKLFIDDLIEYLSTSGDNESIDSCLYKLYKVFPKDHGDAMVPLKYIPSDVRSRSAAVEKTTFGKPREDAFATANLTARTLNSNPESWDRSFILWPWGLLGDDELENLEGSDRVFVMEEKVWDQYFRRNLIMERVEVVAGLRSLGVNMYFLGWEVVFSVLAMLKVLSREENSKLELCRLLLMNQQRFLRILSGAV